MAILPHRIIIPTPKLHHDHHQTLLHIHCSATAPPNNRRVLDNQSTSLTSTTTTISSRPPTLNDPDLKSTWTHRAWVSGGCAAVLATLAKSVTTAETSHVVLEPLLAAFLGYIVADLGSGLYHFGVDNYGGPQTPVFGSQIEAFQGHHKYPWTITRRQFANNLHALGRVVMFAVLPVELLCEDPVLLGFVGMFSGCIMFSQQFHAWAHSTKSRLPKAVVALQDYGVLVSRSQHADHHRAPYNNNYCIVSGIWNEVLDGVKFFEALEMVIYFRFGVRPRSWADPNSEWVEDSKNASSESL